MNATGRPGVRRQVLQASSRGAALYADSPTARGRPEDRQAPLRKGADTGSGKLHRPSRRAVFSRARVSLRTTARPVSWAWLDDLLRLRTALKASFPPAERSTGSAQQNQALMPLVALVEGVWSDGRDHQVGRCRTVGDGYEVLRAVDMIVFVVVAVEGGGMPRHARSDVS